MSHLTKNRIMKGVKLKSWTTLAVVLLRCATVFADDGHLQTKKTTDRKAQAHVTVEAKATTGFDTHETKDRTEETAVRLYQISMIGDTRLTKTLRLKFGLGVQNANVNYSNSNIDHSGIGIALTAMGDPVPYFKLRPEFKIFEHGVNALYFFEDLEGSLTARAKITRANVNFLGRNIDLSETASKYIALANYRTFIHTIGLTYHQEIPVKKWLDRRWLSWIGDNVDPTGEGIIISPYVAYVRLFFDLDAVYTPEGKRLIGNVKVPDSGSQSVKKGKFNWDRDAAYFAITIDIPVIHGTHLRMDGSYLPISEGSIYQVGLGMMTTLPY